MKNIIPVILILFVFTNDLISQSYNCGLSEIIFSDIMCDNMGTQNPDDDIITFVITGNDNSNDSIFNLPLGTTLQINPGGRIIPNHAFLSFNGVSGTIHLNAGGSWLVQSPSPGCQDLNLTMSLDNSGSLDCSGSRINVRISPNDGNNVPTMGEWGLLVLFLLLSIFGIIWSRQYNMGKKSLI